MTVSDLAQSAGILARLRAETRAAHFAIEQTLPLTDEALTLERYTQRLKQFYVFYQPVEAQLLQGSDTLAEWLNVQERCKTQFLRGDLNALGYTSAGSLPLCRKLPVLASAAERFGCMYVLEGSTMGGQLITRHIRDRLGIRAESGGRFFNAYGDRTGAMWHQFKAAITAFAAESDEHELIINSAQATFETLRHWCEEQ